MAKKTSTDKSSKEPKKNDSPYGRELQMGMIVRMKSPETSFQEALAAGPDSAFDYFGDILQGLRLGHIRALRKLKFFEMVEERLGVSIDVGSWEEVKSDELEDVVKIIKKIRPSAEPDIQELFDDLLDLIKLATDQDCSVGFMLSDEELMDDDDDDDADDDDDDWRKPDPEDEGDWEEKFVPTDFDDDLVAAAPSVVSLDFDDDFGGGFSDFDDFGGGSMGGSKKKKKK